MQCMRLAMEPVGRLRQLHNLGVALPAWLWCAQNTGKLCSATWTRVIVKIYKV